MTDTNLPAERGPQNMNVEAGGNMGFGGSGSFNIAPQSLGEVVGFSKIMAGAGHAIPAHLRGNPGACMAVTLQALSWEMSPFQVALQTYKVGDSIAYMAQVIAAVINARAGLKHRPLIEYSGEGPTRQCRVTFTFKNGDVRDYLSPMVKDIAIKNSPLWKNDPDQQLSYFSQRSAARRHCPEVILGVYDPDELENAEPIREGAGRVVPTSLRSKLADQTGKQGFDPNHVQAETGGEPVKKLTPEAVQAEAHDPTTGEVIEGEATQVENDPPQPRTESEQKDQLAAALASLDAKPTPAPEPETAAEVQAEVETPQDSADDLIRQNAYDDGFAGEPVDAVLVMCEDEREEALARTAHAEGAAKRITKEAEEHAASEAAEAAEAAADADQAAAELTRAATPAEIEQAKGDAAEIADVAGPAPAGEKYLLGTEEPAADGKLNLYQDGEVFSRVPAAAAAGKYDRYDGHPQPADPALATQSGGTGVVQEPEPEAAAEPTPEPEPAAEEPKALPGTTMRPNGLYKDLAAKESWLQIKPLLTQLYASESFKKLSPEEQAATRAHLWGAVLEMKERQRDPVDHGADPAAFSLWMDFMAAGDWPVQEKIDAISGTLQTLQGGKTWKDRLTDAQRTAVEARVAGVLSRLKS